VAEKKLNIYQKINAIMKEISYVQKTGMVGSGSFGYKAVLHDHVTALIQPYFVQYGLVAVPNVIEHTFTRYDVTTKKGVSDRYQTDIKIELTIINADDPSETITSTAIAQGLDPQDKASGKAYSMAVKYCYLKLLMLASGDQEEDRVEEAKVASRKQAETAKVESTEKDSLAPILIDLLKANGKYESGKTESFISNMNVAVIKQKIETWSKQKEESPPEAFKTKAPLVAKIIDVVNKITSGMNPADKISWLMDNLLIDTVERLNDKKIEQLEVTLKRVTTILNTAIVLK